MKKKLTKKQIIKDIESLKNKPKELALYLKENSPYIAELFGFKLLGLGGTIENPYIAIPALVAGGGITLGALPLAAAKFERDIFGSSKKTKRKKR